MDSGHLGSRNRTLRVVPADIRCPLFRLQIRLHIRRPPVPPKPPPERRATRLPGDWEPDLDDMAYALKHELDEAHIRDDAAPGFCEHWHSKPGAAGRKYYRKQA